MIDTERKPMAGKQARGVQGATGGGCLLFFSLPFIGVGVAITLISTGLWAVKSTKDNAPPPVLGAMGLLFAGAGLLVFYSGIVSIFKAARVKRARESYPDMPWEADHPWDRRAAYVSKSSEGIGSLIGFVVFFLFLTPFNWMAFFSNESNFFVIVIVGIFDAVLVAILCGAAYAFLQGLKYGKSTLRFEQFPFRVGEKMNVFFSSSRELGQFNSAKITLRCVEEETVTVRTSKGSRTQQKCVQIYAEELKIDQAGSMGAEELPISFDIPKNQHGTSLISAPVRYWELEISADTPGVDFEAEFLVPVYKT